MRITVGVLLIVIVILLIINRRRKVQQYETDKPLQNVGEIAKASSNKTIQYKNEIEMSMT